MQPLAQLLYARYMPTYRRQPSKASQLAAVVVRVIFITLLFTLIGMGIGLFVGIITAVALAYARNVHPDMQFAYLRVAFPTAAIFGVVTLIYNVVQELRRTKLK